MFLPIRLIMSHHTLFSFSVEIEIEKALAVKNNNFQNGLYCVDKVVLPVFVGQ
jgi:hypothetical protein